MDEPMQQPAPAPAPNVDQSKGLAVAARFPILFWLPLITGPKTPLGMFHANQGLVHLITWFAGNVILVFIPILGWILIPFWHIINVIFMILGMLDASRGGMKHLPIVGGIKLLS